MPKKRPRQIAPRSRKIVVVGDGICGKTCLCTVFIKGSFPETYVPTVFENSHTEINIDNKIIDLQIWDTAGQDDYERIRPIAYHETDVILLCFSVDNPGSLQNIKDKWLPEVRHYSPKSIMILVGNKSDLRKDEYTIQELDRLNLKPVSKTQGHRFAEQINAYCYIENSALLNSGVQELFETAVRASMLSEGKKEKDGCCTIS